MLSEEELRKELTNLESDRIERTVSYKEDKIAPAVCAFSNDFPNHKQAGYIFLGVKDDGSIAGMKIDDKILQGLGGVRSNGNVLPQPAIIISQVYKFAEGEVVVIEVLPSPHPPVRYSGKVWIRIGPRKAIANEAEERILTEKRTATAKTFDAKPCFGSVIKDLSIDVFRNYLRHAIDQEVLAENHRDIQQQLASLRLYDGVYNCPSNGGILLLGINPLFFLPGAYLQYVRFEGKEITSPVKSEKRFDGDLYTVLKGLDDFIKNVIIEKRPIKSNSMQEYTVQNYPFWALRELLMNAVMHRNYESNAPIFCYEFSDRIEIVNPGGLYGDARPENFPNTSDYRNPVIAEAMKNLGYVNRFNIGIRQAQAELKKNGNRPAEFDIGLLTKFSVKIFKHSIFCERQCAPMMLTNELG